MLPGASSGRQELKEDTPVPQKAMVFVGLSAVMVAAIAVFVMWRLSRLAQQRAEAGQRAAGAFEQMSRLTKELHERGKETPTDPTLAPGERLQQMYPGPKRARSVTPHR